MSTALILTIVAIFFFLSLWKKEWALSFLLAGLPLYTVRFSILGIPSTLLEAMILVLSFVWTISNARSLKANVMRRFRFGLDKGKAGSRPEIIRYPFDIEMIAVLLVSFLAMWVAGFDNDALGIWKAYFFEPLLLYVLVFNIFFKMDNGARNDLATYLLKIIMPFSFAAFYVSAFAVYQKLTGNFIPNELWQAEETRRVTAFYGYPNAIGLFLGPIIILMFSYLISARIRLSEGIAAKNAFARLFDLQWFRQIPKHEKFQLVFIKISLLLSLLAIYFAKSDGAIIAVLMGVLLIAFFAEPLKLLGKIRLTLLSALILIFIILVFSTTARHFALERLRLDDFSGQVRKAQWQETGVMLRDGNWLWGAGLANYQEKIGPYHAKGIYLRNDDPQFDRLIEVDPAYQAKYWQPLEIFLYPHNIFLNFWVELGFAGMLVFIWLIVKVLFTGFSYLSDRKIHERVLILGILAAMFVTSFHGIVDVPYFKNDLAVLFWVIVALSGLLKIYHIRENLKIS